MNEAVYAEYVTFCVLNSEGRGMIVLLWNQLEMKLADKLYSISTMPQMNFLILHSP